MRKSLSKLVLRKETVKALVNMDLARVIGGADQIAADTGAKECNAAALAQSGNKQCG